MIGTFTRFARRRVANIINTFAGKYSLRGTTSGDGGVPTNAGINDCAGVTVGPDGNVYIAETLGNRIRVVNTHATTQTIFNVSVAPNTIQTIAGTGTWGYSGDGGQAVSAAIAHPASITFDAAGNLYFGDQNNGAIRMITPGGVISTVLGGSGGLIGYEPSIKNCPAFYNVTAVAAASGGHTTYTGTFPATVGGGSVVPGSGSKVYIQGCTNPANNGWFTGVSSTSGTLTVNNPSGVAESGSSAKVMYPGFDIPQCAVVDTNGNIYVPDAGSATVKFYNAQSTPVTVWGVTVQPGYLQIIAGTGYAGYSGDGGPAISAQIDNPVTITFDIYGNAYLTDWNNNVVRKVTPAGIISTWAGKQTTLTITGVTHSGGTNTYTYTGSITLPPTYNAGDNGVGLTISGCTNGANNGYFLLISTAPGTFTVDCASGVTETPSGATALLGVPGYSGDGGQATSAALYNPQDLKFDSAGNAYIVEASNCIVRKVTPAGIISTVAGNESSYGPPQGAYAGDGGPATSAGLYNPIGCAFNSTYTKLYISEYASGTTRVVSLNPPPSTWSAPTVSSVSPTSGQDTGGVTVNITGTNFYPGATVVFNTAPGATPATNVVVNSWSSITCTAPAGTLGATVGITVTNTDTQYGTLANAYTFTAPTIAAIASGVSVSGSPAVTLNTTTANLLVAVLSGYNAAPTISDSVGGNSNAWNYLPTVNSGSNYTRIAYAYAKNGGGALQVGSGHVFTPGGSFAACTVFAFDNTTGTSGVCNANAQTASEAGSTLQSYTLQPGSMTPTAGSVVIMGFGNNGTNITSDTPPSGFTGEVKQNTTTSLEIVAAAYELNASGSAINPSWVVTLNALTNVCIAAFK